jgi:hypothetical protein
VLQTGIHDAQQHPQTIFAFGEGFEVGDPMAAYSNARTVLESDPTGIFD